MRERESVLRPSSPRRQSGLSRGCWAIARLLRGWLRDDRIRVSPKQGALLRLRPPCVIRVGAQAWVLKRRAVGVAADGPYVAYAGEDGERQCTLRVRPASQGWVIAVHFEHDGEVRRLAEQDVVIYG